MSNDNCPPNCIHCSNEELIDQEAVVELFEDGLEDLDDGDSLFISEE